MKKKMLTITVMTSLAIASCGSESNKNIPEDKQENVTEAAITANVETDVPFIKANNYFVNNTYKDGQLASPKISNQEEFDKIFGMATVMGKDGKPTPIDFSKQYVIAVIGQTTDKSTTLTVNSLKQKENVITLSYQLTEGEKQTSSITPFLLIIIDSKYAGEVKVQKNQ